MADEARAMLDALMGGDRNALLPEGSATADPGSENYQGPRRTKKSCYDRDICPLYCAWGVDVYELFRNTKSDTMVGINQNVVDDAAREEFTKLPKREQERLGFEAMLFRKLQELVQKCDRTVNRNKEKLRQEMAKNLQKRGGQDFVIDVDDAAVMQLASSKVRLEFLKQDVVDLSKKLEEAKQAESEAQIKLDALKPKENGEAKKEEADEKKEDGEDAAETRKETDKPEEPPETPKEADDSQGKEEVKSDEEIELEKSVEKARVDKQRLLATIQLKLSQHGPLEESIATQTQQLHYVKSDITSDKTVCEISGNFMSARDADERIAAHYAGKQYVGWKLVREKLKKMIKEHGRYGPPGGGGGPPPANRDGGYRGGGGGYRGDRYHNDRDRSRDRGGYRPRRSPSPQRWERGGGYRGNDRGGGDWRRDRGGGRDYDRRWRR